MGRAVVLCLVLTLLSACVERFDALDPLAEAEDLCADSVAFERLEGVCRAANEERPGACGGVLSFRGRLAGAELAVSDRFLAAAHFENVIYQQGGEQYGPLVDRFEAGGSGEYFAFSLRFEHLGAPIEATPGLSYRVGVSPQGAARYHDDIAQVSARVTNGLESEAFFSESGRLDFVSLSELEARASFTLGFPGDEELTGCMLLLRTSADTGIEIFE